MFRARNFSHAINSYEAWLKLLEDKPDIETPEDVRARMRAVLQTLRDRLTVAEALHSSAQLPQVARGVFFEVWKPDSQN